MELDNLEFDTLIAIENCIKGFKTYLGLKKFSSKTISSYEWTLNKIFMPSQWKNLTENEWHETIDEFFTNIQVSSSAIGTYLSAVNKFQDWLVKQGGIVNPVDYTYKYRPNKQKNKVVRSLTDDEVNIIFDCIDNVNDLLAITILLETGIRIDEFDKYFNDPKKLTNDYVEVAGKSKSDRIVVLSPKIKSLATQIKTDLIWPDSYPGKDKRIKAIATKAGISLNAHLFRATFATNWIYRGYNPVMLQHAMGHSSLAQLEPYISKNQKALTDEWNSFNAGKNNNDITALQYENKYLKLENERLKLELEGQLVDRQGAFDAVMKTFETELNVKEEEHE